ncbi:MAG: DUF3310 domain-containing protein [Planctomycetes bacterium]|nr:DUF3310 domain-containing protein [Planctomycetota bacterium]
MHIAEKKIREVYGPGGGVGIDKEEAISHPKHYGGDTPYEIWKVLWAWGYDDFFFGNIIKYIMRAGNKSDSTKLQDLQKAQQYLNFLIEKEMEENGKETYKDLKNIGEDYKKCEHKGSPTLIHRYSAERLPGSSGLRSACPSCYPQGMGQEPEEK